VNNGIACRILIQNEQLVQMDTYAWVNNYRRWWVYDRIPYQVKQRAGDRGITAENMEKSQNTDFNKDTTNESASMACSNVRLWKQDTQKEWRNTSWPLWEERFCRCYGQQRKQMSGFLTSWCEERTVRHCQSKETSMLWSHHVETREFTGEEDNTMNNARRGRQRTHGLDG